MRNEHPQTNDNQTNTVITLVHGTWAKNASWTSPDSQLYKTIKKKFGAKSKIKQFEWSGKNTHSARRDGANSLSRQLNQDQHNHENARHYVIAHSHGGNIALNAVSRDDLAGKISGIVCMSTPFLTARKRDLGPDISQHIAGALTTLMFVFMFLFDALGLSDWGNGVFRAIIMTGLGIIVMGIFAALILRLQQHSKRIKSQIVNPKIHHDRLLIMRSPVDEASAVLIISQFISQLTVRFYLRVFGLYQSFEIKARYWSKHKKPMLAIVAISAFLFMMAVLLLSVTLYPQWITADRFHPLPFIVLITALLTLVSSVFLIFNFIEGATILPRLIVSIVIWPVIATLSLMLLPFGWEIAAANLFLEVTTESTPAGKWTVNLIEPENFSNLATGELPLRHSMIYNDPNAIELMCNWIKSAQTKTNG